MTLEINKIEVKWKQQTNLEDNISFLRAIIDNKIALKIDPIPQPYRAQHVYF